MLAIGTTGILISSELNPDNTWNFETAIGAKEGVNATVIRTGTLWANLIKAGILSDVTNSTYINMETGEFNFKDKIKFIDNQFTIDLSNQEGLPTDQDLVDLENKLQGNINDVASATASLESTMNGAFKDGILTEAEKESMRTGLKVIVTEQAEVTKDYRTLYNNPDLTGTPKSALALAFVNYDNSTTALITLTNEILQKTDITETDKTNMNNAFIDHDIKLVAFVEKKSEAINAIAEAKKDEAIEHTNTQFTVLDGKISSKVSQGDFNSYKEQTAESINSKVSNGEFNTYKEQTATSINSKVSNGDFETYKTQTATEISNKVSEGDMGTLIQQNANAVKIAWNNYTNYVQFEFGGLAIYNGSISTTQKRAFFDEDGNHFWRDGYYLGKIGTNQWNTDNSKKGIVFDLNHEGSYMTWASKRSSTDTGYYARLLYANKDFDKYTANKLYLGAVLHCQDYGLYDPTICFTKNWFEQYQASAGGLSGAVINRFSNNAGKMFWGSGVASSMNSIFELGYTSGIQAYRSLNMNGYSITNSSSVLADEYLVEEAKDPFVRYLADDYSSETISLNATENNNTIISSATRTLTPNIELCGTGNIVNGRCQIDFTDGVIYDDYVVNLTAIGRNIVYLMEKNDGNFVVEADTDCSFDYIVKFITKTKEILPVSLMNGRENRSHIQSGIPDEAKEIILNN